MSEIEKGKGEDMVWMMGEEVGKGGEFRLVLRGKFDEGELKGVVEE